MICRFPRWVNSYFGAAWICWDAGVLLQACVDVDVDLPGRGRRLAPVPASATLSAAGLTGIAAFQVALAAGAPWGDLSWGGAGGEGVLPTQLRAASAASAGAWLGAAALVFSGHRRATRCVAGLLAVGSAMNAASPSRAEARLWAPVSLALAGVTAAAAR